MTLDNDVLTTRFPLLKSELKWDQNNGTGVLAKLTDCTQDQLDPMQQFLFVSKALILKLQNKTHMAKQLFIPLLI